MAFTVSFYTFSKKVNSTAQPSNPVITVSCSLKDNSGVLNPVLEIDMANNPGNLNYCYIQQFSRYYWVNDWTWILGRWEVSLTVDVLATFRIPIALAEKYVVRSAYEHDNAIIDDFYPAIARRDITKRTIDFDFGDIIANGMYVIGVVGSHGGGLYGSVQYYAMYPAEILNLINFMFPDALETWNVQGAITYTTESLIRSIYNPFDYIVSCKWFPHIWGSPFGTYENIWFGNYQSSVMGKPLLNLDTWGDIDRVAFLPTNFINLEAKYRTSPNCKITVHFEPWGIIELNPNDFDSYMGVVVNIIPDYATGKAILRMYEGNTETKNKLLHESIANLAVPVSLAKADIDIAGFASGVSGAFGSAMAQASTGNIVGALSQAGNVASSVLNLFPRLSGISGATGQFAGLDGICTVTIDMPVFAHNSNGEFGAPLYAIRRLGDLGGYIKCGDGDIDIPGCYYEELQQINDFLTNGFYMEV